MTGIVEVEWGVGHSDRLYAVVNGLSIKRLDASEAESEGEGKIDSVTVCLLNISDVGPQSHIHLLTRLNTRIVTPVLA